MNKDLPMHPKDWKIKSTFGHLLVNSDIFEDGGGKVRAIIRTMMAAWGKSWIYSAILKKIPFSRQVGIGNDSVLETYENSFRRQFRNTRRSDLPLGTINRFAHLPSNSFLTILPAGGTSVKIFSNHVEVGLRVYNIFQDLVAEKELLSKAVASLNTVRRRGKQHISLVEIPEDDGVAE
ncbi:hypothetical protein B0H13DRAFT_1882206 [Mycena leptocephala]|nr:hypothetical protein B0H13DRAFT_1882206 [Mycena leptocephala]